MSNVLRKEIPRPIGPTALANYVARAVELGLEKPSVEEVADALKVTIAFKRLTRREGIKRSARRDEVVDWAVEHTGKPREEIRLDLLQIEESTEILMRMQATDILSAIVWDDCAGIEFGAEIPKWYADDPESVWVAKDDPGHWGDAEDWFVSECLSLAWEANPHLAIGAGHVPFA